MILHKETFKNCLAKHFSDRNYSSYIRQVLPWLKNERGKAFGRRLTLESKKREQFYLLEHPLRSPREPRSLPLLSASPTENCLSIPGSGLNCRPGENSHSRLRSVSVGCSASASLKVGSACARAAREDGSALGARGSRRRRGECPQVRRCARAGRGGLGGCGGSAPEAEARTPLARARAQALAPGPARRPRSPAFP